jgi:uncharacterized protein YgiM (DUF1202 family)
MIRLLVLMSATLVALYAVMSVYGAGDPRAQRQQTASPAPRSAAQDAGARDLIAPPEGRTPPATNSGAPTAGNTSAEAPSSAPEVVSVAAQTPQRVQQFPGPALRPSPEYAGQEQQAVAAPPPGAQGPILYVTGNSVNFRAGPSTGDRVIGALGQGAAVEALGPTDGAWVNIRDTSGRIGYMSGQFLTSNAPN